MEEKDNDFQGLENNQMSQNSIVFDLLLMEADRIKNFRIKELDLYYINPIDGDFTPIGEAYQNQISTFKDMIFRRKKTRYFITFAETLDLEDELKPVALKVMRRFARVMTYGNIVQNFSFKDIEKVFHVHPKYVGSAINQLLERDCIRFKVHKNRRTYMINPVYYFKGTTNGLFSAVRSYDAYPRYEKKD